LDEAFKRPCQPNEHTSKACFKPTRERETPSGNRSIQNVNTPSYSLAFLTLLTDTLSFLYRALDRLVANLGGFAKKQGPSSIFSDPWKIQSANSQMEVAFKSFMDDIKMKQEETRPFQTQVCSRLTFFLLFLNFSPQRSVPVFDTIQLGMDPIEREQTRLWPSLSSQPLLMQTFSFSPEQATNEVLDQTGQDFYPNNPVFWSPHPMVIDEETDKFTISLNSSPVEELGKSFQESTIREFINECPIGYRVIKLHHLNVDTSSIPQTCVCYPALLSFNNVILIT
jgi:hypothetical protein